MSDIAIYAENLGKRYRIGRRAQGLVGGLQHEVRRWLQGRGRTDPGDNTIWALRDVSFDVKKGEVFGIVGHNGAGKSTLLKILSRITPPTEGEATIRGRTSSLLEVGAGFHPELSGRDNVFLNGAILGMARSEIARKLDDIVAFAEVEKFIDTPVKWYSSGMFVRLAFSVAAHLEPDVLLVDEVLAVGDGRFWSKSVNRMRDLNARGMTIVLVTHSLWLIQTMCTRAMCLKRGGILAYGDTLNVIGTYRDVMEQSPDSSGVASDGQGKELGKIHLFQVLPVGRWATHTEPSPGSGIQIVMIAETNGSQRVRFCIRVTGRDGFPYFSIYSPPVDAPPGGRIKCSATVPRLMLMPGEYIIGGALCQDVGDQSPEEVLLAEEAVPLFVRDNGGHYAPRHSTFWNHADWQISNENHTGGFRDG
jgi:ABC-type polysaccharide/polyol phosphate transport system ATPase subunit